MGEIQVTLAGGQDLAKQVACELMSAESNEVSCGLGNRRSWYFDVTCRVVCGLALPYLPEQLGTVPTHYSPCSHGMPLFGFFTMAGPARKCLAWEGGREGKGPCPFLAPPCQQESRHQATLSIQGSRASPESQAAGALGDIQTEPSLDRVLQERDEAIAKKRAVEAELDTCKARLRAVEAQLLEVLEEKLRLRQEVEAWEEDMQQMVRQRVQSQLQRESRGALGTPGDPGAARSPWARLGRWW
ncbi:uncharacterized protein LOC124970637 [Sciurus carolinensis]|uniref:uncharacterized protein LOC124970637 n=1 Tax=Sciurus carolinensis TaxID=30640 RepID=UPI001FB293AF|nr:uncharacterized protein LOC124970637 [Sciurus carolinensis]